MKTKRIIIVSIGISIALVMLSIMGFLSLLHNSTGYVIGTKLFFTHCSALKLSYATIVPMLQFIFPCIVAALMLAGMVKSVFKSLQKIKRCSRLIKNFPVIALEESSKLKNIIHELNLTSSVYFFDTHLVSAFTAGILFPKIYVSTGMAARLSEDELKSVMLHEKYHIENRDVLKIFLVEYLADCLFFLPVFRQVSKLYGEYLEKVIDEKVSRFWGGPLKVATTLLKIVKLNSIVVPIGTGLAFAGRSSFENRIRYLIDKKEYIPISKSILYRNILIAVILFVPLLFRVVSSSGTVFPQFKNSIDKICEDHNVQIREHHQGTDTDHH